MYCPEVLGLSTEFVRQEAYRGLYGFYQNPIGSLANEAAVASSLYNFVCHMNYSLLGNFLSGYLKKTEDPYFMNFFSLPKGRYFLKAAVASLDSSRGFIGISKGESAGMYMDGSYGFLLCWQSDQKTRPLALATTSFSPGNHMEDYDRDISYPDIFTPVIIQLQALHRNSNWVTDNEKILANNVLIKFRWEHALIALDVMWAQGVGLSAIHILPAEENRYFLLREESIKMRYDISAQRSGFRPDKRGLYTLELS